MILHPCHASAITCFLTFVILTEAIQLAQDNLNGNQPFPACSHREIRTRQGSLQNYHERCVELVSRLGTLTLDDFANHTDEVDELIADTYALQVE